MQAESRLDGRSFDVLVVGGGINGVCIARDAALRGLSVLLVEANDWGWATSSKSSKLAHGGLRYLEQFEFALVHEALQDRERMLRQAPHLVRPLRFLYPIYPHVASRRTVRAGLLLYDVLSHGKSVPGRHYLGAKETLAMVPGLEPTGLKGGATFYDAQIRHVERLVWENVEDARAHGATTLNHTRLVRFVCEGDPQGYVDGQPKPRRTAKARTARGVAVEPAQAPPRRVVGAELETFEGQRLRIHCRTAVNATGCWVDDTLGELALGRGAKVRKTKGIHVVVPRFTDTALIVKARSDGRTFFILPWEEHCVLGTTDTDYQGDAGDAVAQADEVAYLLDEASRYFPDAPLEDIRYTYAGVRALVNEQGLTESNVTRRHILYDHAQREGLAGLWSLQGGKITTARSLAEECVDLLAAHLDRPVIQHRHPTREEPLPGAPPPGSTWDTYRAQAILDGQTTWRLGADCATHLVDTYGAQWTRVLQGDATPEGLRRIVPDHPHLYAEVTHAVGHEQATTVGDVMLRRTSLGLAADGNPEAAHRVAAWMARLKAWDDEELERQLQAYAHEARVLAVPRTDPVTVLAGAP